VQQFVDGFMFTAGGIAAFLVVFAVAAFCELVSKLVQESGRTEIRNAIVDNAEALCALSARLNEARSEIAAATVVDEPDCEECGRRGGYWDDESIDQWHPCPKCNP